MPLVAWPHRSALHPWIPPHLSPGLALTTKQNTSRSMLLEYLMIALTKALAQFQRSLHKRRLPHLLPTHHLRSMPACGSESVANATSYPPNCQRTECDKVIHPAGPDLSVRPSDISSNKLLLVFGYSRNINLALLALSSTASAICSIFIRVSPAGLAVQLIKLTVVASLS